jgi:uncharacterized protein YndB with AHSA1/START domain
MSIPSGVLPPVRGVSFNRRQESVLVVATQSLEFADVSLPRDSDQCHSGDARDLSRPKESQSKYTSKTMTNEKPPTTNLLEIERELKASPREIFAALTQPDLMGRWFYGMENGSARVEQDFRVGGKYTIFMIAADGSENTGCQSEGKAEHAPHGEYLEIVPDQRLVFTWVSEGFVDHSVVTIELSKAGDTTRLVLRHELPEDAMQPHREGWTNCLRHLVGLF